MTRKPGLLRRLRSALSRKTRGYELADEDLDAFGSIVEVIERVEPDHTRGRIRFRGTTWPAMAALEPVEPGRRARVIYRDNLAWVVEPYHGLAAPGEKD